MKKLLCILLILTLFTGYSVYAGDLSHSQQFKSVSTAISNTQKAEPTPILKVHYLDVGQADCILIQTPSKKNMLIDAGNNEDSATILSYLKALNIKKIDILIGTHPHEDHIGSMDTVIKSFDIGAIYMPKVSTTTKTFEDVLLAIKAKGLKVTTATAGIKIEIDPKLRIEMLAPNSSKYDDLNNYSAAIKVIYGKTSFLFDGDAEDISEKEMLAKNYDLKADVLKIGHHGSNSSTTPAFLKAVSPKYAIISVGKGNDYGHPTKATIDKLASAKVQVYRTDLNGTIIATSNGDTITFDKKTSVVKPKAQPANTETKTSPSIEIVSIDLRGELVTLKNNSGKDVDMTGWKLVSVTGNQSYNFPKGYIIKAGKTITIASGSATGDLKWSKSNIWNNDGDPGQLYDSTGKLVSSK